MVFGAELRIRPTTRQDMVSLALAGELDLAAAPTLRDFLAEIEEDDVAVIMLDLRGVTFIDSAGLNALIQAKDRAQSNRHRLILVEASEQTRRLLELTRTEYLLDDMGAVGMLGASSRTESRATGREADPKATRAAN